MAGHPTRAPPAHPHKAPHPDGVYGRLVAMIGLSFIAMYVLMYAMVDRPAHIHPSLNQAYMAALMTAPMVLLELLLMGRMYPRKRLNMAFLAAGLAVGLLSFTAIRQQWLIGDRDFLASMIPHHSGALLMCGRAPITNPDIQTLCASILKSQQAEIDQMEAMRRAAR